MRKKLKKSKAKVEIRTDKTKTVEEAGPIQPDLQGDTVIEVLVFKLANEEYAVRITDMQEVLKYQTITPVPRTVEYLKGIISLRGKILPIIDLKDKLGAVGENGGKQRIIVLSGTDKTEPLGAVVSTVIGVLRFPETRLFPPLPTLTEKQKDFIEGVLRFQNRFISLLKVDEVTKT